MQKCIGTIGFVQNGENWSFLIKDEDASGGPYRSELLAWGRAYVATKSQGNRDALAQALSRKHPAGAHAVLKQIGELPDE